MRRVAKQAIERTDWYKRKRRAESQTHSAPKRAVKKRSDRECSECMRFQINEERLVFVRRALRSVRRQVVRLPPLLRVVV